MSGKKRSEVIDVLQEAEHARKRTNDNLNNSIKRDSDCVENNKIELKIIQNEIGDVEDLSKEAKEMFGKEACLQEKKCAELLLELRNFEISDASSKNASAQLKTLEKQLQECDREAAAIRRAVASKPHYCDEEFKRAKQLKKQYDDLSKKRQRLSDEISSEFKIAREKVTEAKRIKNELKNLQESIKKMNTIAKNRVQANEWKKALQQTLEQIPLEDAKRFKKFNREDFLIFSEKVKSLVNKEDAVVNEKAAGLLAEINNYKAELVSTIELWEKQKADAEALYEQSLLVKEESFVDPVDFLQNGDDAVKIPLFEYIGKYVKTAYNEKFTKIIKNAENALEQESFTEAYKLYEQANLVVKEAKNKALLLQETMFKNLDIAQKIDEAMYSLGYDVDTQIINDNPNDGFRIVCSCGDEIIDFTRVVYDDNGNPVVDIDHTESRTGTCGKSWEEIVKRMREQGLPIEAPYLANGEPIWHESKPKSTSTQVPGTRKHI